LGRYPGGERKGRFVMHHPKIFQDEKNGCRKYQGRPGKKRKEILSLENYKCVPDMPAPHQDRKLREEGITARGGGGENGMACVLFSIRESENGWVRKVAGVRLNNEKGKRRWFLKRRREKEEAFLAESKFVATGNSRKRGKKRGR